MLKIVPHKESICFNFENNEEKQFFDKAKRSDIIRNNNSVFLHKILSIKNQSLLNYTLKKVQSQILNNLNTSLDTKKENDQNNTTRYIHRNQSVDLNYNSPHSNSNSSLLSPKIFSPKIMVNKNKNLGSFSQKEKEKEKLYLNTTYFNRDNTYLNKIDQIKRRIPSLKDETTINPEICFSNLYTCNYLRKPVVIKFNNGFNTKSIQENNTINSFNINKDKKINISISFQEKENDKNKENINKKERVRTDERIRSYNFAEKNRIKPELYRSFEDLEKKSKEITKRRLKKKSSSNLPILDFKKEDNLIDVKQSLDHYILKSKSKSKKKHIIAEKKSQFNKNRSSQKTFIKKDINFCPNSFRNKEVENEFKDLTIKTGNITFNNWQNKRNNCLNKTKNSHTQDKIIDNNNNTIDKTIKTINYKNIKNIKSFKSEKILKRVKKPRKNCYIKKKNISINYIDEKQTENIYNISLNPGILYNNFSQYLNYNKNHNIIKKNEKNTFIRNRYGKKNNLFEDYKTQNKIIKKELNRGNKTPNVKKKFIEDYRINDNISGLSYSQSQSFLSIGNATKQIKVNKKKHNSHKRLQVDKKKDLPSILEDEEEKIKNEIKNSLNVLNGFEILNKVMRTKNINILKEIFKYLIEYYIQIKSFNYSSTLVTNLSQISSIKYVKKIIPVSKQPSKDNFFKLNKHYSKANIMRQNHFNVEKQKLILLKRKELGFFERYEHCKDFIDNLKIYLIKYFFKKEKKEI